MFGKLGRISVDVLGHLLAGLAIRPKLLDAGAIIQRARHHTGLRDLGHIPHPEGLGVACRSLRHEAGLGLFGKIVVRDTLVNSVANRLRYVDARARVPQRFDVPLVPPIFVLGLPRSGTTFLHRLLCAVPGARGIPIWESRQPIASTPDTRRRRTAWMVAGMRTFAPELMAKHAFELDSPEEAIALFDASLGWNPFLWRVAGCRSYVDWLLLQDASEPYRIFVDLLHWIAAPTPDHRLILKTPNHMGFVDLLHDLLPEAIFIQTHRDPARCIPSYASLSATMHGLIKGGVDRPMLGAQSLKMWRTYAERVTQVRAARPDLRCIDVDYDELVGDPMGTVTRVFAEAALPLTHDIRTAVQAEIDKRPANRHGKHTYSTADFGLTEAGIRQAFEQ